GLGVVARGPDEGEGGRRLALAERADGFDRRAGGEQGGVHAAARKPGIRVEAEGAAAQGEDRVDVLGPVHEEELLARRGPKGGPGGAVDGRGVERVEDRAE